VASLPALPCSQSNAGIIVRGDQDRHRGLLSIAQEKKHGQPSMSACPWLVTNQSQCFGLYSPSGQSPYAVHITASTVKAAGARRWVPS
jgi:hypothetical protein